MFDDDKIKFNFMKGFNLSSGNFFDGYIPLKEITYGIAIVYDNNYRKDVYGITNPWSFINALKKNPRIKATWIIDENNP